MSDLRDVAAALTLFDRDIVAHEESDAKRFKQLQDEAGRQAEETKHLGDMVKLLHDQMIEGFRAMGAKVADVRRSKNGR